MSAAQRQFHEGFVISGHYQIENLMAIGDTSDLYGCHEMGKEKTLALKVFRNVTPNSKNAAQFGRVISFLQRLRHPGLGRILDFGLIDNSGKLYFVEELIEGADIVSATEGMPTEQILGLIAELAGIIHFLHSTRTLHGKLKPSNIILSALENSSKKLTVVDYGLLPLFSEEEASASENGMLAYTAPEILLGNAADEKSDLYSLGVLIYQLLARRLPFEDDDPGFLAQKHLQGRPDLGDLSELINGTDLIEKLLAKDPSERPSAREVIEVFLALAKDDLSTQKSQRPKHLSSFFLPASFVGRDSELLLLQDASRRTMESARGRTIFVTGEAGIGKTRIMEELRSWAILDDWRIVEGYCGIHEETAYEPYRQILSRSDQSAGKPIFSFGEQSKLTDSRGFDSSLEFASGQYRDRITRELVRRLSGKPTILFLHDFHLADEATIAVLDYLSSDIQAYPIVICVSARSGEENNGVLEKLVNTVMRQDRGEVVSLKSLPNQEIKQLMMEILGESDLREALSSWMINRIAGNPFFLEEMLKHLVEQKVLHKTFPAWSFSEDDLLKLDIPAGINSVLQRRLEQLSHSARALINWLALFHRPVPGRLLIRAHLSGSGTFEETLEELLQREIIQIEFKENEEDINFRHEIIAQVIRKKLSKNTRKNMHREIAEILEEQGESESRFHELTFHHIEGKSNSNSVRHVLASALQYRSEFSHENALRCFLHVLENSDTLSEDEICSSTIEACNAMFALGKPDKAISLLEKEMRLLSGIELKARMFMQLALAYQHVGDHQKQEESCMQGLRLFNDQPEFAPNITKAGLWSELAFGEVLRSRPQQGLLYLENALKCCPEDDSITLRGRIHLLKALLHRVACNFPEALINGHKSMEILSNSAESILKCSIHSTLGGILAGLGRFSKALEEHKNAILVSEKSRSVILKSQAFGNYSECLCRMGFIQEANNVVQNASKFIYETSNPSIITAYKAILAEIKLATCNFKGAIQIINELVQQRLSPFTLGHLNYVAANLQFTLGHFDTALMHIENLCKTETAEAPFYERELVDALKARILFEQGKHGAGMELLLALDNVVAKKHWPYHMCLIKLYISELLIQKGDLAKAKGFIKSAMRLAKGMGSVTFINYGNLLLGFILSHLYKSSNNIDLIQSRKQLGIAVEHFQFCCKALESSGNIDFAWRAHAELCFAYLKSNDREKALEHGRKSYELLCKLEDQIPADSLTSFHQVFGRSAIKKDLVRLLEMSGREECAKPSIALRREDENVRVLLRLSSILNTSGSIDQLLTAILDLLLPAIRGERAVFYLEDKYSKKLEFKIGRTQYRESLSDVSSIELKIIELVRREGNPIISHNCTDDPRFPAFRNHPGIPGKILCAPLRSPARTIGILFADAAQPGDMLSESTISLFAAFCSLSAMAIENALIHQNSVDAKMELTTHLLNAQDGYKEIVGASSAMNELRERIGLAAASPLDILIHGESGTGKELIARAIYRTGRRKAGQFIAVDCGALVDTVAEAELFGYRKGAFTGATENRQGLLEAAHGGIIFLDELSNLPLRLQAKLLRVLQEREVRRIGEVIPRKIDVQVVAASNKDLLEEVRHGRFRGDLFYRLKTMEIVAPPLRNRSEDIPVLIEWFLQKIADSEEGRIKRVVPEAIDLLMKYSFPGNVRELRNIVAGAYYSTVGDKIGLNEMPPEVRQDYSKPIHSEIHAAGRLYRDILEGKGTFEALIKEPFLKHQFGSALVREIIQKALQDSGGKYKAAFSRLRIPDRRYMHTMQFLKRNECYIDFHPFRKI